MAEYIEREALLRDIEHYHVSDGTFQHWVQVQPAADVVPVVRCKDCRKRKSYECPMYFANGDEDFCSYGEYQRNTFEGEK